ncbi:hypothetical protein QR680_004501 [Steinernema hermaphroditum]|uniref:Uncharacterized protein n=1 Tax=Steinernema hermaphroditum TaxID=289476 RepID=A0AA39HNX3_9BILA|nr:hypothetical protein QR680_004501 [Steinernema hermaphroditum]
MSSASVTAAATAASTAAATIELVKDVVRNSYNTAASASSTLAPTLLTLNGFLNTNAKFWSFWIAITFILIVLCVTALSYCIQLQEEREEAVVAARHSREQLRRERVVNEQLRWHQRILGSRQKSQEYERCPRHPQPASSTVLISMPHDEDMTRSRMSGEHLTMTSLASTRGRYARVAGEEEPTKPILKNPAPKVNFSNIDLNEPSTSAAMRVATPAVHQAPRRVLPTSSAQNFRMNEFRGNPSYIGFTRDI